MSTAQSGYTSSPLSVIKRTCGNAAFLILSNRSDGVIMPYKTKEDQSERDRIYYANNAEKKKAYHRAWYQSNKELGLTHVKKEKRIIKSEEENRQKGRICSSEYRKHYPERIKACMAVGIAIKKGILVRQPCIVCGNEKSQAHHDDYSKMLEVKWLCQKHHKELHRRDQ
jgi:hypothetical protein